MAARLAALPELRPYEYSRSHRRPARPDRATDAGADVTASFAADRATAAADGIAAIRAGFRLAVPVALRKGDPVPSHLTLASGGEAVTVAAIDGDQSDHRWADPHGVAVILRLKRSRGVALRPTPSVSPPTACRSTWPTATPADLAGLTPPPYRAALRPLPLPLTGWGLFIARRPPAAPERP